MILRTTLSTLLLLCSLAANAQDFFSEFIEHFNARDTLKQRLTLEMWEAESPEDPELFVSYFNYYFERSKVRGLQLSVTTPDGQTQGSDENRQDINDFLADKTFFVGSIFNKGISNIDRGIGLYPDRLDMRYAKIDALGQNEEWDAFVAAIKDMVARSSVNKNQWLGVQNAPYEGNEETFLSKIQEYHITILNLQDIQLLPKIRESAEAVLSYYPKHVTSLSDLGVTYLIEENYEKTLEVLLRAEEIDDQNTQILANIAFAYRELGDTKKAIRYYKRMIKTGDPKAIDFAEEQLHELSN